MDKWLAGLIITAVGLPLLMFVGNLKSEVSEEGGAGSSIAHEQLELENANADSGLGSVFHGLQEPPAITPEVYLGYQFALYNIGNDEGFQPEAAVAYTTPSSYDNLVPGVVYFGGNWKNNPDGMELVSNEGRAVLRYTAKTVNITAGPGQKPSAVQVLLDNSFVNSTNSGTDVENSVANIDEQRLFSIVMDDSYHTKTVEINVMGSGFRLYKFTFG